MSRAVTHAYPATLSLSSARRLCLVILCILAAAGLYGCGEADAASQPAPSADAARMLLMLPDRDTPALEPGPMPRSTSFLVASRITYAGYPTFMFVRTEQERTRLEALYKVQADCANFLSTGDPLVDMSILGYCLWNKLGYGVPVPIMSIKP